MALGIVITGGGYLGKILERSDPEYYTRHFQMGGYYLKEEVFDLAARELEKAVEARADSVDARYFLGITYQRMGKWEQALEEYRRLAEEGSDSYEVFNYMGIVYGKLGNRQEALQAFNHAVRLNPAYYPAYFNRANLYEAEGNIDLAAKEYQFIKENAAGKPETEEFARRAAGRLETLRK